MHLCPEMAEAVPSRTALSQGIVVCLRVDLIRA